MNKYGLAAVKAAELLSSDYKGESPNKAWDIATSELFGKGTSSQMKVCPKNAFLGLCEEGLIKGVTQGNYTNSKKNKDYATRAVEYLIKNPDIFQYPRT